jgi:predicted membrane channel-forming protein YqfA (hemolysin III family)
VLLAALDYRWLARRGVVRPFTWAWSFLGGVPYVIGRAVILHKVAPRRGLWHIAVIVAAWGLYLVAGAVKSLSFMQAVFSELGYPT